MKSYNIMFEQMEPVDGVLMMTDLTLAKKLMEAMAKTLGIKVLVCSDNGNIITSSEGTDTVEETGKPEETYLNYRMTYTQRIGYGNRWNEYTKDFTARNDEEALAFVAKFKKENPDRGDVKDPASWEKTIIDKLEQIDVRVVEMGKAKYA